MSIKQYNDLVQLNVWVTWPLRKRVKRLANALGESQSQLVRRALGQYLDENE